MHSHEIRTATVSCTFFEISLRKPFETNNTGKWL